MASESSTKDPFPLFHLSPLDFSLDDIPALTAAETSLVPFHPDFKPDVHFKIIRKCFRQKREKRRNLIDVLPIGIFARAEDRTERWPGFELINLSWSMDSTSVENLTSAQLAVAVFHPDAMLHQDFVEQCEELFFQRRERDFALGLSLPPFAPSIPPPKPVVKLEPTPKKLSSTPSAAPVKSSSGGTGGPPAWLDEVESGSSSTTAAAPISPPRTTTVDKSDTFNSERKSISLDEYRRKKLGSADAPIVEQKDSRHSSDRRRSRSRSRSKERLPAARNGSRSPVPSRDRREKERERDRDKERDKDKDKERDRKDKRDRDRDDRERDDRDERDVKRNKRIGSPPSASTTEARPPPSQPRDSNSRAGARQDEDSYPSSRPVRRQDRPPLRPDPSGIVPPSVILGLHTIYIRSIDRRANLSDLNSFLLSTHQVGPVALRMTKGTSEFSFGFAVYENMSDAELVMLRLRERGRLLFGTPVESRPAHEPRPHTGQSAAVWKWDQFSVEFREQYHERQMAEYRRLSRGDSPSRFSRLDSPPRGPSRALSPPRSTRRLSPGGRSARKDSPSHSVSGQSPPHRGRDRGIQESRDPRSTQSSSRTASIPARGVSPRRDRGRSPERQKPRVSNEGGLDSSFTNPALSNHVVRSLSQLLLSNLPMDVELSDLREYFDPFEGIVGVALGRVNEQHANRSGWGIFSTEQLRDAAYKALSGKIFPGSRMPLYLRHADFDSGCTKRDWRWLDMSKEFRINNRDLGPVTRAPRPSNPTPSAPNSASHELPKIPAGPGDYSSKPSETSTAVPSSSANIPYVHPSRRNLIPPDGPSSASNENESKPFVQPVEQSNGWNNWQLPRQQSGPPAGSSFQDQWNDPLSHENEPRDRPRTPTGPRSTISTTIKGGAALSKRTGDFFNRLQAALPSPQTPQTPLASLLDLVQTAQGSSDIFKRVGLSNEMENGLGNGFGNGNGDDVDGEMVAGDHSDAKEIVKEEAADGEDDAQMELSVEKLGKGEDVKME